MNLKSYIKRRKTILGVLTALITVSFSITGYLPEYKTLSFIIGVSLTLVYTFALNYYENVEEDIEEIRNKLESVDNNRKSLECMISEVQSLLETASEVIRRHNEQGTKIFWDYDYMCAKCCESVYRVLEMHSISKVNFSVSYVTKLSYQGDQVKLNGYKNTSGAAPGVYQKERKIDNNGHYDLKIFSYKNPEYIILLNKEEILSKFQIHNPNSMHKYNQYVALPVVDNTNRIVGLLQIIAFEEACLGETYDEVKNVIITYFRPFLPVFLLLYQINNTLHISKGGESDESMAAEEDK